MQNLIYLFKTAKQDSIVRQAIFIQRGRRSLALILETIKYSVLTLLYLLREQDRLTILKFFSTLFAVIRSCQITIFISNLDLGHLNTAYYLKSA